MRAQAYTTACQTVMGVFGDATAGENSFSPGKFPLVCFRLGVEAELCSMSATRATGDVCAHDCVLFALDFCSLFHVELSSTSEERPVRAFCVGGMILDGSSFM